MKDSQFPACASHVFVCVHSRPKAAGMPCCADASGEETFDAIKGNVAAAGLTGTVWVTKTACLGFCNADGTTVALYPEGRFLVSVKPNEAKAVVAAAVAGARRGGA